MVAVTFPVVAPLNVLALSTVIVASLAVIACAAIPENFSLDPTAPLLLIMVFNELKSPAVSYTHLTLPTTTIV